MTTLGLILATAAVICIATGAYLDNDWFFIAAIVLAFLIWLTSPTPARGENETDIQPRVLGLFAKVSCIACGQARCACVVEC